MNIWMFFLISFPKSIKAENVLLINDNFAKVFSKSNNWQYFFAKFHPSMMQVVLKCKWNFWQIDFEIDALFFHEQKPQS